MYRYSFKEYDSKTMARALGKSLDISLKHAIEISSYIKGKKLSVAQQLLKLAIQKKKPIPFRRFTEGAGHKPGIGSGKYVVKASSRILKLLREVEANATAKGIIDPVIIHISAKKAPTPLHYGRHPGRKMKRTHVEVVVSGTVDQEEASKKSTTRVKAKHESKEDKPKEFSKEAEKPNKAVDNSSADRIENKNNNENKNIDGNDNNIENKRENKGDDKK